MKHVLGAPQNLRKLGEASGASSLIIKLDPKREAGKGVKRVPKGLLLNLRRGQEAGKGQGSTDFLEFYQKGCFQTFEGNIRWLSCFAKFKEKTRTRLNQTGAGFSLNSALVEPGETWVKPSEALVKPGQNFAKPGGAWVKPGEA